MQYYTILYNIHSHPCPFSKWYDVLNARAHWCYPLFSHSTALIYAPAHILQGIIFFLRSLNSKCSSVPCGPLSLDLKILHNAPFFQNGAKSGFEMCFGLSTLGAGAKIRLESRIKEFTPHCVCSSVWSTAARSIEGRGQYSQHKKLHYSPPKSI